MKVIHSIITIATLFVVALFVVSFGIGRHDVDEKEYLQLAKAKQFDCVGEVRMDSVAIGSCIIVSEKYILSAAHIFLQSQTKLDTIEFNNQKIVSYTPINERIVSPSELTIYINGQKLSVKRLIIHPNYGINVEQKSCDIALLELEKPIKNISFPVLNTSFDEVNSTVVGVGYGASGKANAPEKVGQFGKKIAGENVVDSIGGFVLNYHATILFLDFDHPTNSNPNKMGSAEPKPLEYICSGGDSGGGLFRKKGNQWELVGICSGSAINIELMMEYGYYGQTMVWTRVSALQQWIRQYKL